MNCSANLLLILFAFFALFLACASVWLVEKMDKIKLWRLQNNWKPWYSWNYRKEEKGEEK